MKDEIGHVLRDPPPSMKSLFQTPKNITDVRNTTSEKKKGRRGNSRQQCKTPQNQNVGPATATYPTSQALQRLTPYSGQKNVIPKVWNVLTIY